MPIYTVGYGNRSIETFIKLLTDRNIQFLIDIRSKPYSRYNQAFTKSELETILSENKIRYVFMGDTLGGRPDDASCYTPEGLVSYEAVEGKSFYQSGIARLKEAAEYPVALMCSELRPEDCHRSKLIGETLGKQDVNVLHIDEAGFDKTQAEVIKNATAKLDKVSPDQLSFLNEDFAIPLTSRKKYEQAEDDD
jgi:uncharacterized protein (DUF488 family)